MESIKLTDQELTIKSWLGLPSVILSVFFAIVLGGGSWMLYLGILLLGWYLYSLLYWKLYQRLILKRAPRKTGEFYSLLIFYQLALFGAVLLLITKT